MKKFIAVITFAIVLIACKKNDEKQNKTSSDRIEKKTEIKIKTTQKRTEISFKDYKNKFIPVAQKAPIDFKGNPAAKRYKTVISEAYQGKVNFAGHYIIATWGCGISCISGVMVDVRDGKVYDLPIDKETELLGNSYKSKKESSLLITSITNVPFDNTIVEIDTYWNWIEATKKFEYIKKIEIAVD